MISLSPHRSACVSKFKGKSERFESARTQHEPKSCWNSGVCFAFSLGIIYAFGVINPQIVAKIGKSLPSGRIHNDGIKIISSITISESHDETKRNSRVLSIYDSSPKLSSYKSKPWTIFIEAMNSNTSASQQAAIINRRKRTFQPSTQLLPTG